MRIAVLACLLLLLAGPARADLLLEEDAGNVPVRAHLAPFPPRVGAAHVTVEVDDEGPPPPGGPSVTLLMDMPDMPAMPGVKALLAPQGRNRYEADVDFSMEGRWRLRFEVATLHGRFQIVRAVDVGTVAATPAPEPRAAPPPEGRLALTLLTDPPRVGDNRVRIQAPPGTPPDARIFVGADMPGMAMPTRPLQAQRQPDGAWEARVPLAMEGLWRLTAQRAPGAQHPSTVLDVTVPAAGRGGPSPTLLLLCLAALAAIPAARRRPLAPCLLVLAAAFAVGAGIERCHPADTGMGMEMDMSAPDMGMGAMVAPLPVLEARVGRLPFTVTRRYPGTVHAEREVLVSSPAAGFVRTLAPEGRRVRRGETLATVDGTPVAAPQAGAVLRRIVEPGSAVQPGQPLVVLADLQKVRVRIRVPVADRHRLAPGAPVSVLSGGAAVAGRIEAISALGQGDAAFLEAVVPNVMPGGGHGSLRRAPGAEEAGMFSFGQDVLVRCVLDRSASVLCVPRQAVRDGAVYVIEEIAGRRLAHRRVVTVGARNDTHAEIVSGLREGEVVVAVADDSLRDGSLVAAGAWAGGAYKNLLVLPEDPGSHGHGR